MRTKADWVKIIHTAKGKLGLDDVAYRALIKGVAGVESSREIVSEAQYRAIMAAFRKLGFSPRPEVWGCSEKQKGHILGLWFRATGSNDRKGLLGFVKRTAHVDSFRFLTPPLASTVIVGLEAMAEGREAAREARSG